MMRPSLNTKSAVQNSHMIDLVIEDRECARRAIMGGLKDAINQHGPIEESNISSAVKRIYGQLDSLSEEQSAEFRSYVRDALDE